MHSVWLSALEDVNKGDNNFYEPMSATDLGGDAEDDPLEDNPKARRILTN